MGGNFLTTGFPTARWEATNSAADLATAINSIDRAILHALFGGAANIDFTGAVETPVKFSDALVEVLHDFKIGSSSTVDDIVDAIPIIPGMNEAHELATVDAIRDFIAGGGWGEGLFIHVIDPCTAGNIPLMDADGELVTSAYDPTDFIPKIVTAVVGNFPVMTADGYLNTSGSSAYSFMKRTSPEPTAGNLPVFTDGDDLSDSGYDPTDFMESVPSMVAGNIPIFVDGNTLEDSGFAPEDLAREAAFGAVQVRDAMPGTSTSTLTTQMMDSIIWYQGKGNSIFSLNSGKVKVAYAGLYCVHLQAIVIGSVQVRLNSYCDGGGSSWAGAEAVSGDSYTYCDLVGWHALDAEDELEFKIRTPAGNASIQAFVATVVKAGPDGATFTP